MSGLIVTKDGNLLFNGEVVSGIGDNQYGLYATTEGLFYSGNKIADASDIKKGIYISGNALMFGSVVVGGSFEPVVPSKYWTPPTQEPSTYKPWSYVEAIALYDELMAKAPDYMTKHRYEDASGNPILTESGNYELFSYILEPESYSKTIFISCGVHGNEMDAKQQLLRIVDILVNKTNQTAYKRFAAIRNDCRLVIIPFVSPYGHDTASMNIPYTYNGEATQGINLNRNYDFNQQWALAAAGVGGDPPFDMAETRHVRDVFDSIGAKNIDYAMDFHDGGNVAKHYWINYAVDSDSRTMVDALVHYLIDKYNITDPVIPDCKDTSTSGIAAMYYAKTMGVPASTVEWIGGLLGYDFDSSQMTQSMEIRGNMLLLAYESDIKGWRVNEPEDAQYFHFDYPKAFTKAGLRFDGADARTKVTDAMIYSRWDKLAEANPHWITKSDVLGVDVFGTQNIYTYTFGNGPKKVLYVGGIMRYGGAHKIDEFAIYELVEYLCDDYIVEQSKFLQELRKNYTIIVLPCIDNDAGNSVPKKYAGLNNMALSYKKWQIVDGKCQPTTLALEKHDVPIVKKLIDDNQDLVCIVSGGEILTGYAGNSSDYSTEFETQFVLPKNQTESVGLTEYLSHLTTNRNEDVLVEHTVGTTFGDYAFDNYGIPTYFIQLNVSKRFTELADFHTLGVTEYLHCNYEAGRRMANIVNSILLT